MWRCSGLRGGPCRDVVGWETGSRSGVRKAFFVIPTQGGILLAIFSSGSKRLSFLKSLRSQMRLLLYLFLFLPGVSASQSSYPFWLLPVPDTARVYDVVDELPMPWGGMIAINRHLLKRLVYSEEDRRQGIEGRAFIQFIVEKDGALTNFKALKPTHPMHDSCNSFDQQVIRVLQETSPWQPGKQHGQPVRVRMVFPVLIKLG